MRYLLWLLFAVVLSIAESGAARAAGETFDILEFAVEGNSVLPVPAVEKAVYPFLGEGKTIQDVEAATVALQKAYRDAGYPAVIVDIPEQDTRDKVVRLRVTEGTVGELKVTGNRYYSAGRITAKTPSLAAGTVPNFAAAQRELAALSRDERRITPVLRPGLRFGTTDVDLNVQDRLPLHGSLELNNYYGPNTSELRLVGSLRYDNVWQRDHSASVQYQVTPEDTAQIRVFSASYFAPVASLDSYVGGYYARSRSNVITTVGDIGLFGSGDIFGLRWIKNLPGTSAYRHSLSFGADYKDFKDDLVQPGMPTLRTPIQYMPLSLTYSGFVEGQRTRTNFTTGPVFGIRGLVGDDASFAGKRFNARSNFMVWKWLVQHTRPLAKGFSLFVQLDGQATGDALVSNEQFFAGGVATPAPVRGYLEAEALGDNGTHVTFEARSPSLAGRIGSESRELVFVAFADAAFLSINDPLPRQQVHTTLASVGLGLRWKAQRLYELVADFGVPLRDSAYTRAGDTSLRVSGRIRF